eukprot:TRINITY_DN8747_c1_g1_i2.p1 TRINITY_DN8747_c1_g1~~TRINITY_DN8747_c1_g1_i2.p1  ORF type:complete len:111 (+),score=11.98 TRINITY_DN8747_c1_g1_i2:87-419(+)
MLQAQPSTVLQAILRLSSYSVWIWLAAEALLLIWKGFFLPYTDGALASEWIVLVLLQLTELTRLHWGSRGNLLQESKSLIFLLATDRGRAERYFPDFDRDSLCSGYIGFD